MCQELPLAATAVTTTATAAIASIMTISHTVLILGLATILCPITQLVAVLGLILRPITILIPRQELYTVSMSIPGVGYCSG